MALGSIQPLCCFIKVLWRCSQTQLLHMVYGCFGTKLSNCDTDGLAPNTYFLRWQKKFPDPCSSQEKFIYKQFKNVKMIVTQLCPTLCDSWTVCSLPSFSIRGILQARKLDGGLPFPEWGSSSIEQGSPALQADSFPFEPPGKPKFKDTE